jgi:hypothetical protein
MGILPILFQHSEPIVVAATQRRVAHLPLRRVTASEGLAS